MKKYINDTTEHAIRSTNQANANIVACGVRNAGTIKRKIVNRDSLDSLWKKTLPISNETIVMMYIDKRGRIPGFLYILEVSHGLEWAQ